MHAIASVPVILSGRHTGSTHLNGSIHQTTLCTTRESEISSFSGQILQSGVKLFIPNEGILLIDLFIIMYITINKCQK